jgi:hypothetical protein
MKKHKYVGRDLVDLARTELSDDFLRKFCLKMPDIYRDAYAHAYENFGPAQAKDLLPHIRRAKIESHLETIAGDIDILTTDTYLNTAKNCRHVRVSSKTIVLTANAVAGPREMVRSAIFRTTLAESNQLFLFPEVDTRPKGDSCYSMILHGPQELEPARVGFIYLVFPSYNSKSYIARCNLVSLLNITLYPSVEEEKIKDTSFPELKKNISIQVG